MLLESRGRCVDAGADRAVPTFGLTHGHRGGGNPPCCISAFPERVIGSACASSFSRFARRSLALRPAHTRCHLIVTRIPKASASSLPPWVLRLLPAGAFWRVGFTLIGKRRLSTAHTRTGRRGALCVDVGSLITLAHLLFRRSRGALTRRAKYRRAQVGDPHLDFGIGWSCVATAPLLVPAARVPALAGR
jgi:hypothetical protein